MFISKVQQLNNCNLDFEVNPEPDYKHYTPPFYNLKFFLKFTQIIRSSVQQNNRFDLKLNT